MPGGQRAESGWLGGWVAVCVSFEVELYKYDCFDDFQQLVYLLRGSDRIRRVIPGNYRGSVVFWLVHLCRLLIQDS